MENMDPVWLCCTISLSKDITLSFLTANVSIKDAIGGFRNSQSDVIFAHAHIRCRQRFGKLNGTCVKCGFIF